MNNLFKIYGDGRDQRRVLLAPAAEIGVGGVGGHGAVASRSLRASLVASALEPSTRAAARTAVLALTPMLNIDTAEFEEIILPLSCPGFAPESLGRPDGYERLASPDGFELLAQIGTPVARHMRNWGGLDLIREKRANSEGEGIPLYGCANLLASVGLVWRRVRSIALRAAESAGTWPAMRLAEFGVEVRRDSLIINVYAGLGGATGTGSTEVVLAMLGVALDEFGARGRAEIRLHLLGGSYHSAGSEEERLAAAARAAGLLRRLNEYEARLRTITFELPGDEILTMPLHLSYRLADATFLHTAMPGESYPEFVRRVSLAVCHAEIGPCAARLRLTRANSPARRRLFDDQTAGD